MNKHEITEVLKRHGFTDRQIVGKNGGIEVLAAKRISLYEFDYDEFVGMFGGALDKSKVHFIDSWTFAIECHNDPTF